MTDEAQAEEREAQVSAARVYAASKMARGSNASRIAEWDLAPTPEPELRWLEESIWYVDLELLADAALSFLHDGDPEDEEWTEAARVVVHALVMSGMARPPASLMVDRRFMIPRAPGDG